MPPKLFQPPSDKMDELMDLIDDVKKGSGTIGRHPYANLDLQEFVYRLTGIPTEGYHDVAPFVNERRQAGLLEGQGDVAYTFVHNQMAIKLMDPMIRNLLILIARQHGKSTWQSEFYPTWEILRNPRIRIIIISESKSLAVSSIKSIGQYLEGLGQKFEKNDEEEKTVVRPKSGLHRRDPTLLAFSTASKLTGRHCDIMILDDTVVRDNSYTEPQRRKYEEWFGATISNVLESTGRLIVTGVRWRHADFHGVLADPIRHPEFGPPSNQFLGRIVAPACTRDFKNVLWPAKWNEATLRLKQMAITPLYFASQFLLDPSAMEGGSFKIEWILGEGSSEYYELPDIQYRVLGVDPSLGVGQNMFAQCIAAIGTDNKMYVENVMGLNVTTGEQPYMVVNTAEQNKITKIGIEQVGYQVALKNAIAEKVQNLQITGYQGPVKKEVRLSELAAPLLTGKIRFPATSIPSKDKKNPDPTKRNVPWMAEFQQEYLTFPTGEVNDRLDSLYYAYKVSGIADLNYSFDDYEPVILGGKLKGSPKYRSPFRMRI